MDKQDFQDYLENRYYNQIKWYGSKSRYNQKMYKSCQIVITIFAVITPMLLFVQDKMLQWVAIVSSLTVAIGTALIKIFKYQENWINYRTTSETIKKEIHYYNARLHDYADAKDPEALFVDRVESLISRENTLWLVSQKPE